MSVIFHVGLPKSASTFLQRRVFPCLEDTEYISSDTSMNESIYEWVYKSNCIFNALFDNRNLKRKKLEKIHNKILNKLSIPQNFDIKKNKLVSSEGFVGASWDPLINSDLNAKLIKYQHPSAKIFLVLRKQSEWLKSIYRQLVFVEDRFDQYISFNKFSNIDSSQKINSFLDLRWDLLVEQYYSIFGRKNVLVLPYEFFKESPQEFVEYFTGFFNLKIKRKLDFFKKENEFNKANSIYKNKLSTKKILSSVKHLNYEKLFHQTSSIFKNISKSNEIKNYESSISDEEYLFSAQKKLNIFNKKLGEICDYDFSNYLS
tara:strand:+ start:213 stop:1160 length:948 start_codon:yes stop_codon:yes gene_type:complete